MSAAQLIPMISPDGQPGHVAANEVEAAVKAGYKRGAMVTSPKGESGVVSIDELPAAIKGGYKPAMQMQAPNAGLASPGQAPQVNMQQLPISAAGNAALKVNDLTQGSENALQGLNQMGNKIAENFNPSSAADLPNALMRTPGHVADAYKRLLSLHGAGQQLGLDTKDIEQASLEGNKTRIIGDAIPALALAMIGGGKANAMKEEMLAKPAATTGEVARLVTDTVNPPPKSMAGFQKSVEAQIPEVIQGKKITNRAELGQAFSESANKAKQSFYDTYINPIKDASAYGGRTIGQLDARLSEINATLKPTYEKGGATAQAALSAENKAALKAEAAGIRNNMNQAIADKLNVPVEQVATARQKFGQMYDVADKIQLALNNERHSANKAAKQVPALDVTAAGLANKGIQAGWRKLKGHPADNAVREALANYDPAAPQAGVSPSVSPPSTRPAAPPIKTVELNPQTSSVADIQNNLSRIVANRMSRAKQQTLPLKRAKPRWMQE